MKYEQELHGVWSKQWKKQNEGLEVAARQLDMGSLNWHSYGPELEINHIHFQSSINKTR